MEELSLSTAGVSTDDPSRLDPSMFSADASPLIRTVMPDVASSQFIGSDPSLGVSVLRRSKEPSSKPIISARSVDEDNVIQGQNLKDFVAEEKELLVEDDEIFDNVELYIKTCAEDGKLGRSVNLNKGDVEQRAIELDPNTTEVEFNLNLFTDQRFHSVFLQFDYTFTQDELTTVVHSKSLHVSKQIKSQSPFKIEWQVLSNNPFVSSLKTYLSKNLNRPDDLDFRALTSSMVCSSEETCMLMCKLTSMSASRELCLLKTHLEVNPSLSDFIE
jgi:hypothetical protein